MMMSGRPRREEKPDAAQYVLRRAHDLFEAEEFASLSRHRWSAATIPGYCFPFSLQSPRRLAASRRPIILFGPESE